MVRPGTGSMKPVPGAVSYPAAGVTEKASFQGAEVLVDGPRVIFNNPDSLLAVVVFTDHSHAPVIVNKSTAVIVSAAGPGDANVKAEKKHKLPADKPSRAPFENAVDHSDHPAPAGRSPSSGPTRPTGHRAGRLRNDRREALRTTDQLDLAFGRVGTGRVDLPPADRAGLPPEHVVGDRHGSGWRPPAGAPGPGRQWPAAAPFRGAHPGHQLRGGRDRLHRQAVDVVGPGQVPDDRGGARCSGLCDGSR